MDDFIMCRVVP